MLPQSMISEEKNPWSVEIMAKLMQQKKPGETDPFAVAMSQLGKEKEEEEGGAAKKRKASQPSSNKKKQKT
jgi:hypothetical protein